MKPYKSPPVDGVPELVAHATPPATGSDRSFGIVFAGAFAIIAVFPLFTGGQLRLWAIGLSAVFLVAALVAPRLLGPLNALWGRVGLLLNRIVSPVALLLVFAVAVLPTGWLLRLFGKDPLRRSVDRQASTYWIERVPPGRPDGQMKKQF
jgi:hypothetical protein